MESIDTVVIGGGQAGLAVGYFLARRGLPFRRPRRPRAIGDAWRGRWNRCGCLPRLRFDGLPGMPFPAPAHAFPTKDQMADYLESYAARFDLPVRTGVRVDRLWRHGQRFVWRPATSASRPTTSW